MANMFKEQLKDFDFHPTEEQWTGVRAFLETPTGSFTEGVDLPVLGDVFPAQPAPFDTPPANFTARGIRITNYNNVVGQERRYQVDYSTKDINFNTRPDLDDATDSLELSSEVVLLEGQSGNAGATTFLGAGTPVDGVIRELIPLATYTTSESFASFAAAVATVNGLIGTISTLDARWLFVGGNISEFINDEGDNRFQVIRTYMFRFIQGPDFNPLITFDDEKGWNLIWNPLRGEWDVIDPVNYPLAVFPDTMPVL